MSTVKQMNRSKTEVAHSGALGFRQVTATWGKGSDNEIGPNVANATALRIRGCSLEGSLIGRNLVSSVFRMISRVLLRLGKYYLSGTRKRVSMGFIGKSIYYGKSKSQGRWQS